MKTLFLIIIFIFCKNVYAQEIKLGDKYNLPLVLPASLTYLSLGDNYNYPLIIPTSLCNLLLGCDYNQPLVVPDTIQQIVIISSDQYSLFDKRHHHIIKEKFDI